MNRREFVAGAAAAVTAGAARLFAETDRARKDDVLDVWQRETDRVTSDVYEAYMADGDTRGLASLEKLEAAFEKVLREVRETKVESTPAVWSVYNMGYVIKTPQATFAIDLLHRRAAEMAPLLDFALITHNHSDHWRPPFYRAMDGAGKTVISNFLDNYGVANWWRDGGYTRRERTLKLKDVEVRASLVDHNGYLTDFTTAFEIRVGDWRCYHTGDCGNAAKLRTAYGRPDLWLFFPGCGIRVPEAVKKIDAKRVVFGHLWELGHAKWRLDTSLIRHQLAQAETVGVRPEVRLWGDRIV